MPKAYLGVLFFDERLNFIAESSSLIRVRQQGDGAAPLVLGNIRAPRNGYAYVYVSNESNEPVFFDDLKVQHRRSALLEETHYYPFGLTMAGISSKKLGDINEGRLKNQYQYQGEYAEYDDETSWNDFELRSYDAQIGRFIQADPYDQFASPYTGMGNDPMNLVDPSGGIAIPCPNSISALSGIMSQVSTLTMILGITSNALQITSTITTQQTVIDQGRPVAGVGIGIYKKSQEIGFRTVEEAAYDWGMKYNDNSIVEKVEYGSTIYKYRKNGRTYYGYSVPNKASESGATIRVSDAPKGTKPVADIHSHGNSWGEGPYYSDNNFSPYDKDGNDSRKIDGYLTTPNGSLMEYKFKTKKERPIRTDLPSDPTYPYPRLRKNQKDPFRLPKNEPSIIYNPKRK